LITIAERALGLLLGSDLHGRQGVRVYALWRGGGRDGVGVAAEPGGKFAIAIGRLGGRASIRRCLCRELINEFAGRCGGGRSLRRGLGLLTIAILRGACGLIFWLSAIGVLGILLQRLGCLLGRSLLEHLGEELGQVRLARAGLGLRGGQVCRRNNPGCG
jgi:hypothetical protein